MTTFESTVHQIPYKQESVYNMLSDLSNIERIKDRIPADKVKDLVFDSDAPKEIKFETANSPLPFNFWIQILPVTETSSKMKLTIKAELNMFIKGMVQKPLQEGIEKIADALAMIPYE